MQSGTAGYSAILKIDGKFIYAEFNTKKALDKAIKVSEPYEITETNVGSSNE